MKKYFKTPSPNCTPSKRRKHEVIEISSDPLEVIEVSSELKPISRELLSSPLISAEELPSKRDLSSIEHDLPTIEQDLQEPSVGNIEPSWTPHQKQVLDFCNQGHSVFFTGAAGTGKSFLLEHVIQNLRMKYCHGQVAVTSSTGISACNIGGQTLHSFAGIGLGLESVEVLFKKCGKAKKRWKNCKVLIIDEISMIEAELFDKIEELARRIRHCNLPFGGIQVIICGDFFQLPPVSKHGVQVTFAFEAKSWKTAIQKIVVLPDIFRQKDSRFIDILSQLRRNQLTSASIELLKQAERPLKLEDCEGIEPTRLYSLRNNVVKYNTGKLESLPGRIEKFIAFDWVEEQELYPEKRLTSLQALKELEMKVGAQVMLIANLDQSSGLVNGTLGTVIEIVDEPFDPSNPIHTEKFQYNRRVRYPIVEFYTIGKVCRKIIREVFDYKWEIANEKGKVIAYRSQIPLVLSWAMSIHKAQGQTIPLLKVDLTQIFESGQAYVALSRATSLDTLEIMGFNVNKVTVNQKVVEFYEFIEDSNFHHHS